LVVEQEGSTSLESKIAEEEVALESLRPMLDRLSAQLQGRLSFEFKVHLEHRDYDSAYMYYIFKT
jgi:hypothetical protein